MPANLNLLDRILPSKEEYEKDGQKAKHGSSVSPSRTTATHSSAGTEFSSSRVAAAATASAARAAAVRNAEHDSSAPVIGEGRGGFLMRRWASTWFGGVRIPPEGGPFRARALQALQFLFPFIALVIGTALAEAQVLASLYAGVVAGALTLTYGAVQHARRVRVHRHLSVLGLKDVERSDGGGMSVAEEEEIDFDECGGVLAAEATQYLLGGAPLPIGWATFHIILAAANVGVALVFLLPITQVSLLGVWEGDPAAAWAIWVFGSLTTCVAVHPLLVSAPAEPNRFRPLLAPRYFGHISRTIHQGALLAALGAHSALYISSNGSGGGSGGDSGGGDGIDGGGAVGLYQALYLTMALLPIAWAFALLPQLDCLLAWVAELLLVFGLGGTPMATDARLFGACVAASAAYGTCLAILTYGGGASGASNIFAAVTGCLLAANLHALACTAKALGRYLVHYYHRRWRRRHGNRVAPAPLVQEEEEEKGVKLEENVVRAGPGSGSSLRAKSEAEVAEAEAKKKKKKSRATRHQPLFAGASSRLLYSGWVTIMTASAGVISGLATPSALLANGAQNDATVALGGALVGLWVLAALLRQAQNVFVFDLVRNPLFPPSTHGKAFDERRRHLARCGIVHRIIVALTPIVSLLALRLASSTTTVANGRGTAWVGLPDALRAAATVRAYRWVWQRPLDAGLEVGFTLLLELLPVGASSFNTIPLLLRLAIVAFVHSRLRDLADNAGAMLRLYVAFARVPSLRTHFAVPLLVASLVLAPLPLGVLVAATVLGAPLLPLFGLPIFIIGYPRPRRFWPKPVAGSSSSSARTSGSDAVYYEAAATGLEHYMSGSFNDGALGNARAGTVVLARWQNRTAYVHMLESNYLGCAYTIKGLELQETSCHTAEASAVEDAFEAAFERSAGHSDGHKGWRNRRLLSTMVPRDAARLAVHTDSRAVLTGLLESREAAHLYASTLTHCLVWVLLHGAEPADLAQWRSTLPRVKPTPGGGGGTSEQLPFPNTWLARVQAIAREGTGTTHAWSSIGSDTGMKTPPAIGVIASNTAAAGKRGNEEAEEPAAALDLDALLDEFSIAAELPVTRSVITPESAVDRSISNGSGSGSALKHVVESVSATIAAGPGGPTALCSLFQGRVPPGAAHIWDSKLVALVVRAHRYACKATLDLAVMGDTCIEDVDELEESLRDFDSHWHFGPEATPAWNSAVRSNKSHLFNLYRDEENGCAASSHMLTLAPVTVRVGTLSAATLRAEWAMLEFELLYAANNDDERYSIQANTAVLRNLSVQAADAPLGYHLYGSRLVQ